MSGKLKDEKEGWKQKVRIGICDDEKEIREGLKAKIKKRTGDQVRIDSYETAEKLLADEDVPDILFFRYSDARKRRNGGSGGTEKEKERNDPDFYHGIRRICVSGF